MILEQAASLKEAVPIILHHHERYGGHGYPYGLRANEIPLGARIVAIADAYDAMTHDRPYKRAMSHENAVEELRRHAGTQFDPELVGLFCDLYATTAPEPDPAVLAMTAASGAHHAASAALALPDRSAATISRPRRTVRTSPPARRPPGAEPPGPSTSVRSASRRSCRSRSPSSGPSPRPWNPPGSCSFERQRDRVIRRLGPSRRRAPRVADRRRRQASVQRAWIAGAGRPATFRLPAGLPPAPPHPPGPGPMRPAPGRLGRVKSRDGPRSGR